MQASPTSSYVSFDPRSRQHRDDVPGSRLSRDFTELSLTSDLKTGTPVATLPSTRRYGVSSGTGWPGVGIL